MAKLIVGERWAVGISPNERVVIAAEAVVDFCEGEPPTRESDGIELCSLCWGEADIGHDADCPWPELVAAVKAASAAPTTKGEQSWE